FFQAEDGIRDRNVTGVQTCALPILKVNFNSSSLHIGKILIVASSVNYSYGENPLWSSPLEFTIKSGDRIHLKGSNGSGKTTLLRSEERRVGKECRLQRDRGQ